MNYMAEIGSTFPEAGQGEAGIRIFNSRHPKQLLELLPAACFLAHENQGIKSPLGISRLGSEDSLAGWIH